MAVKISVIIPAYNAEYTIGRCIDSIIKQDFEDYEIICVDDGSEDNTADIIKQYQDGNDKIKLILQENQYAGTARNNGMSIAQGDYLIFMDADDYFLDDSLQIMFDKITETNADICVCGANQYYVDRDVNVYYKAFMNPNMVPESHVFNRIDNEKYILNFTTIAPWNKLFRRKFVAEHNLMFQVCKAGNDIFFVATALCLAEKIAVIVEPLVCHEVNGLGCLTSQLSDNYECHINAWCETREYLIKYNVFPQQSCDNRIVGNLAYVAGRITSADDMKGLFELLDGGKKEKLGVLIQKPEYYYRDWYHDFIKHICEDDYINFTVYYSRFNYEQRMIDIAKKKANDARRNSLYKKLEVQKEKNQSLRETNESLKEKNQSLIETKELLKEKNRSLREANRSLKEKNQSLRETNESLKEKNQSLIETKELSLVPEAIF